MIRRRVSLEDMAVFLRELERMARSNTAWQDGMGELARREEGSLARLAEAVAEQLRRGVPLSQALRDSAAISPYAVALLKAGEESGAMADALRDAALMYRRILISRRAWMAAARYPLIVFALFLGVLVFLSFTVFPRIEALYFEMAGWEADEDFPAWTLLVLGIGKLIRFHGLEMIGAGVAVVLVLIMLGRMPYGRLLLGNLMLQTPGIGRALYYDSVGRFCRALGQLLERRVPVDAAVILAGGTVRGILSKKLAGRMSDRLHQGGALWEGLAETNLLPPSMVWMVQKAEGHGDAAEVFRQIAEFYDEKFTAVNELIRDMMEPVLLLLIGGQVLSIVGAIYMPMFWMVNAIR